MKTLLMKYLQPVFAPDDGGGSGAEPTPPAGGDGAGAGGGGAGAPPNDPPPAGNQGQAPAAAGQPYRPEGLPETMYGENDQETIDKMQAALKGYRDRDARQVVPEDAAAYADFSEFDAPTELKTYFEDLKDDPIMKGLSDWALQEGKDVGEFQATVAKAFEFAQQNNLLVPMIDQVAEQAKLVPEALANAPQDKRDAAAKARVDAAEQFINLQVQNEVFSKEVGANAAAMLLDTAEGVQFIEALSGMSGGSTAANVGQQSGGVNHADLQERSKLPKNTPSHPDFDQASYDQLMEDYKRLPE